MGKYVETAVYHNIQLYYLPRCVRLRCVANLTYKSTGAARRTRTALAACSSPLWFARRMFAGVSVRSERRGSFAMK